MSERSRENQRVAVGTWRSRLCPSPRKAPVPWILCGVALGILMTQYGSRLHADYRAKLLLRSGLGTAPNVQSMIRDVQYVQNKSPARLYAVEIAADVVGEKPARQLIVELSATSGLVVTWDDDGDRLRSVSLVTRNGNSRMANVVSVGGANGVFPGSLSVSPVVGAHRGYVLMDYDLDGEVDARVKTDRAGAFAGE